MPTIVIVGKGLADGKVEVRDRKTARRDDVAVTDAVDHIVAACRGLSQ
jgi:prolyl-tRNA synthetase